VRSIHHNATIEKGIEKFIGCAKWQANMFATATGIASVLAGLGTAEPNGARQALERGLTRVSKSGMPEGTVV
jgi:hypothetical protein